MEVRCKGCGKPLHDPMSIARGMGPKCAGVATAGKSFRPHMHIDRGATYPSVGAGHARLNLFSFVGKQQDSVPPALKNFPSGLVDLVLSAPAPGSIAAQIKSYSRGKSKQSGIHAGTLLKQIRRMCIEFRLLFWPGLSMNLEPIACIPYGQHDWKIGENGKVLSKEELVAYLSRYGIISSQ
jgi:hypothetical protein